MIINSAIIPPIPCEVSVCNWEQGTAQPRPSTRKKICEILGNDISYPDERPLTINEQRKMLVAINVAAQRIGYQKAFELFADKTADEIRELSEFISTIHEQNILLPPGIESENEKGTSILAT